MEMYVITPPHAYYYYYYKAMMTDMPVSTQLCVLSYEMPAAKCRLISCADVFHIMLAVMQAKALTTACARGYAPCEIFQDDGPARSINMMG